jgi:signal recognition particle subunit SRP54
MFNSLSEKLGQTLRTLRGQGRLTENNIQDILRDVRRALLEADVALPVVKQFTDKVSERAIGNEVMKSLTPGEAFVRIVRDEMIALMGEKNDALDLATQPPAVILMAGLQGSGKTTTVAKLARFLKETEKKKVMVTSGDVYRPAAIDQLKTLATEVGVEFFPSTANQDPVAIAKEALSLAKRSGMDVLIIDTAGRLHIDDEMMQEIKRIHQAIDPIETLFVVDSMTGQDAANTAKVFNDTLPLTGVILTKADGDARGGAALSVREITKKPIKFLGVGEKTDALEPFFPDRIVSQILGEGDLQSLLELAERKIDKEQAKQQVQKLKKSKTFDLEDFLEQIQQMKKMGGLGALLGKMPGAGQMLGGVDPQSSEKLFSRFEAMIFSMTPQERRFPLLIKGSRRLPIAKGSGTQIQDVNKLLKQFMQLQKVMKKFSKGGGMQKMMRQLQGKLPPGGFPGAGSLPF